MTTKNEPLTKVERFFEGPELLNESLELFEKSGFIYEHKVTSLGIYTKLVGLSMRDLFTMRTKFPDAVLFVPVPVETKPVSKTKKKVDKELVEV
jgi:hypothetical protein